MSSLGGTRRGTRRGSRPCGRRAGRRYKGGADLGTRLCFEDESGQGLRPPRDRTLGRRVAYPGGDGDRRESQAGCRWLR